LCRNGLQTCLLDDRELSCPISSEAHTMKHNPAGIDLFARRKIVERPGKDPFGCGACFERRLTRAWTVNSEDSNTLIKNRSKLVHQIFLPAVKAGDGKNKRHGTVGSFRKA